MKGKRVFVSGGAGVIGLEMIPRLVERGAEVFVGDLKPRPKSFPQVVRYRQGDLNEISQAELENFAPEIFIHLAATFERSTETYGFWDENFWHNVRLSHHLMTLGKDLPSLRRVVFASSYLIYNESLYQFDSARNAPVSLKETHPIMPRNLTGMAKLAHEIELAFLAGFPDRPLSSACARIFRGYGRNSRDVISRWVRALLKDEEIVVYRPEGLFDYIYAKDTAEGLIRLAEASAVQGIINLGTGEARRVADIVNILKFHFPQMKVREETSDIPFEASQADMTSFRQSIGWVPEYDIERGIAEIIAHERDALAHVAENAGLNRNILITSASRKVPLVRAMQKAAAKLDPKIQVVAGDLDLQASARYVANDFWQMPKLSDDAVSTLVAICGERQIGTIVPTRDGELLFWARHAERLERAGINVIISPAASVEVCLDKLRFSQFGIDRDLPFIPSALSPAEAGPGPYVVKERYGAGSHAIGLNLEGDAAIEHARTLENPIYQPFVAGVEISVDAWIDRSHRVKGLMLRTRDRVVNGESQITTTFRDEKIEAVVLQALEALRLRGPVVMQVLVDPGKNIHIIECNSRFGGASTISIAAGLDMFYWSLLEATGADLNDYPFHRIGTEIRQIRVPEDIYEYGSDF